MKDTAYLINAARGSIVDEPALIRALEAGKIAYASSLDTLEKEPIDPSNPWFPWTTCSPPPHRRRHQGGLQPLLRGLRPGHRRLLPAGPPVRGA